MPFTCSWRRQLNLNSDNVAHQLIDLIKCHMSSTSSSQSRHDAAEASSSKNAYEDAPEDGDIAADAVTEDEEQTEDLLPDDPLNGNLGTQYGKRCFNAIAELIQAASRSSADKRLRPLRIAFSLVRPFPRVAPSLLYLVHHRNDHKSSD